MSEMYDDDPRGDDLEPARPPRRSHALLITAAVLIAGFFSITTFASFYTDRLWYKSVGFSNVFSTLLWTKLGLFVIFAALMALVIGANMFAAYRLRPFLRPDSPEQTGLDRYRDAVTPIRGWLLGGISLAIGAFAGASATGQWRNYLLWSHGVSFGQKDSYFKRDIGFYVFDLPWLHFLVNFTMVALFLGLVAAVLVHYLYGGVRLQAGSHDRLSGAAQAQFSLLLGLFVLVKAVDYWLDRFDLVNQSGRLITGITYTDDHAVLPAKNILMGIAVICAVLFFLNLWRRTWMLPTVGLALLVMSAILLGAIWPGIVQQFQVDPSEADKEKPYIAANIDATRAAYDLTDVKVEQFKNVSTSASASAAALVAQTSAMPLVDPQLVHAAFEQLQQVRSYYSVAPVLDVDRYPIDGVNRALVLGVRELNQSGLSQSDQNWSNLHTVYTHGNGVIAAFANQRPADNIPPAVYNGIEWAQGNEVGQDALEKSTGPFESRVYFGEQSPNYSIVGKSPGAASVELDLGGENDLTTYAGKDGVSVGNFFNKFMYAVKFGEPNFVLSGRVGQNSKVLYYRTPRERVEKVAPWLTVDGDPYPAIVDGHLEWILDGYTTTDRYPLAQRESFKTMTDDSLNQNNQLNTLPTDEVNYMRNAVKATVDAYDGTVTLYAWDESDPILQAWREAFPGTVKDKSDIPKDLLPHLRYPEDLFKVQRYQFARYHVTNAGDFYQGNDRWAVPEDPNNPGRLQPPYRFFVPGTADGTFGLNSVYVPNNKSNLAAFVSVNSDATSPEYGKMSVLQLPNENSDGPGQVASKVTTDPRVTTKIQSFNLGGAKPINGNLLTVPVSNGLMYIQPVYSTRQVSDAATFATIQYVIVYLNNDLGIGQTLTEAVADLVGTTTPPPPVSPGGNPSGNPSGTPSGSPSGNPSGNPSQGTGQLSQEVQTLLQRAEASFAKADTAIQNGDYKTWGAEMAKGRRLVARALSMIPGQQ